MGVFLFVIPAMFVWTVVATRRPGWALFGMVMTALVIADLTLQNGG